MTSVGHSWPTFEIGTHREDGQKCPSCVDWLATFGWMKTLSPDLVQDC
ncbi:hypothetical protein RBSH_05916 [Rhodopirellula baltica SH28]|uniref:Uncharacterized protein n=1 Tax=Rhodopirellula baltica SH28 TaxID=993517 RepID=K5C7M3_RHOBT|nr:hypothetical protein RBSH_05916 [Rhodopirellula baltica SH28]